MLLGSSLYVFIVGSNAGYTMFRGSVKSTGYPLHSPVSHSLPLPCLTVCHHISTGLYFGSVYFYFTTSGFLRRSPYLLVHISGSNAGYNTFRGKVEEYWLPTPFASFPFTFTPVRHRVPSDFNRTPTQWRRRTDGAGRPSRWRLPGHYQQR